MTRTFNILVIFALVTYYSSAQTVIPLQSHRVYKPVQRNLATGDPTADISINNVGSVMYSGQIQVGNPPQNFSVLFDTGFSDMIFFSNCAGCGSINQYNIAASNSSEDQFLDSTFTYYTDSNVQNAQVYQDYITVGGKYSVLGEFLLLTTPLGSNYSQYDGVVGLGYQNLSSGPLPTLMQLLQIANTGIPQMFALHLTAEANQTGSTLIIGGYDILTAPNGFTFYPVVQSHTWSIGINDFGFANTSYAEGLNDLKITIASGLPYIVAASGIFNSLLNALPSAAVSCKKIGTGSFYLNIEQDMYYIPPSSLYTNNNGTCTLNLLSAVAAGYNDLSDNEILVGIPFLQNYYAMFNIQNQTIGFTVPNAPQPPTPIPSGSGILTISMIFTVFVSFLYLLM